jgi:hypothetical protein
LLEVDPDPAFFLQFCDKTGVEPQALHGQVAPAGAVFNLTPTRQHPGARRTGFASQASRIQQRYARPELRQPPSDGTADDARTGNRHIGLHYLVQLN